MRTAIMLATVLAGVIGMAGTVAARNDPGVTDKNILICSYQPMTGTESSYFRQGRGADAWFKPEAAARFLGAGYDPVALSLRLAFGFLD